MFRYILFDLDGTLTDPKVGITKSVQYALEDAGIYEADLDKLEPFIGPPLADSFALFYGMDEEQVKRAVKKYRERFTVTGIFENEIIEGVPELLARLKAAGCVLSIASSKPTEMVERILEHFDIAQYFDCVVGSELDGRRSKKEEVVEEALRRLMPEHYEKSDVAMVGDRKFDIEGAKAFGLTAVGVRFGYAQEGELEKAGADFIAGTVAELEEFLMGRIYNVRRTGLKKVLCYIYDQMADFEVSLLLHRLRNTGKMEIISISETCDSLTAQSGLTYIPQKRIVDVTDMSEVSALIIPGGPINNEQNAVCELACKLLNDGRLVAAICFAPQFLGRAGILENYRYTKSCSAEKIAALGCDDPFNWENYVEKRVVTDKNLITAQGYAFVDFAKAVCDYLKIFENSRQEYEQIDRIKES